MIALLLTLTACGGGGGGGGGGANPQPPTQPPPPPPPADPTVALAITSANALDAIGVGVALPEGLLQLGIVGVDGIVDLANAKLLEVPDERCDQGGTYAIRNDDADASGGLSAGDTLELTFAQGCDSSVLLATIRGTMTVSVSELHIGTDGDIIARGEIVFGQDLVITSTDFDTGQSADIAVVGSLEFEYAGSRARVRTLALSIPQGGSVTFGITAAGAGEITERYRAFDFLRRISVDADGRQVYTFDFTVRIESELLEGRIDCSTSTLAGNFQGEPVAGTLLCEGAAGSAVRLLSDRPTGNEPVTIQVDPQGDGTFSAVTTPDPLTWNDFSENRYYVSLVDEVFVVGREELAGALAFSSLSAAVNEIVYNPVNDRLYVSNVSGIVEIDPGTLDVTRSLDVGGEVGPLALSDDGSTLWFGLATTPTVGSVETGTFDTPFSFDLGVAPAPVTDDRIANSIAVRPATTDVIVVSMQSSYEIVAYVGGVELPGRIDRGPGRVAFLDATTVLGVDDGTSDEPAFLVEFDPANGVTLLEQYPNLAPRGSVGITLGAGEAVTALGYLFDVSSAALLGRFSTGPDEFRFLDLATIDAGAGSGYGFSQFDRLLYRYDLGSLAEVGYYRLEGFPQEGFPRRMLVAGPNLIIATTTDIVRVPTAEVIVNLPAQSCDTLDVSDFLQPGVNRILTCDITDAVYDSGRNLIYAGIPAFQGPVGSAIVVIDPASFQAIDYIPVRGTPFGLALTDDGTTLHAFIRDSSVAIEVDLDSRALSGRTVLGFDSANGRRFRIFQGQVLTPLPAPDEGIVVNTTGREMMLYQQGAPVGDSAFGSFFRSLYFDADDATILYGHSADTFGTFSVTGAGVVELDERFDVLEGIDTDRFGNALYDSRGERFDLDTAIGEFVCNVEDAILENRAVAVGPGGTAVFYANVASDRYRLYRCDPATGLVEQPVAVPLFGQGAGSQPRDLILLPNDTLVFQQDRRLANLPRP